MTAVLETSGLSKRYGRRWALSDCTLEIPPGHVVGLVGPNGAGKTTLLHLAVGLLSPSSGAILVLGDRPAHRAAQLARVGFVAQETPVYAGLSVADHLHFGAWLNPSWDRALAERRIARLDLDPGQRVAHLSGGQRAVTWWFSPIDRATMSIFGPFDQRDIVPLGYAAFAFALGVTAGALLRRTLPAMATTLVCLVGVRIVIDQFVRPNFLAPLHKTVPDTTFGSLAAGLHTSITPSQLTSAQGGLPPNAWLLSGQTINGAGHVIGQSGLVDGGINFNQGVTGYDLVIQGAGTCRDISATPPGNPQPLIQQCVSHLNIRDVLTYQPASRYWLFQGFELAIFVALAVVLVGVCFWWIRRRAS